MNPVKGQRLVDRHVTGEGLVLILFVTLLVQSVVAVENGHETNSELEFKPEDQTSSTVRKVDDTQHATGLVNDNPTIGTDADRNNKQQGASPIQDQEHQSNRKQSRPFTRQQTWNNNPFDYQFGLEDSDFDTFGSPHHSFMRPFMPAIPPMPQMPSISALTMAHNRMMSQLEDEAAEGSSVTHFERNGVGYTKTCTIQRVNRNPGQRNAPLKRSSSFRN